LAKKMSGKQRRQLDTGTSDLAPEIQAAIDRLAEAHDHARQVLKDAGRLLAGGKGAGPGVRDLTDGEPATRGAALAPHWDPVARVLRVGKHIVKQYRVPSPNQETVLAAFQEEGWPHRVDDPLPPVADESSRDRLRDTIRSLNSSQKHKLIRFHGDGTGEGVFWELLHARTRPAAAAGKK
jgi:hypothetical protein